MGNVWSFLVCWLSTKKDYGSIVLRIEDIDPDRSKPEFAQAIQRDLTWLGLTWDEGIGVGGAHGPYTQSESTALYQQAIEALEKDGLVYPCFCTRKELRSLASAPHMKDYGSAYPEICLHLSKAERAAHIAAGRHASLRLHRANSPIVFTDALCGEQTYSWMECGGDFPLRRSDGVYAYQLAVVLDDIRQGITQIVRGEDILHCTPRQVYLYELLGCPVPEYIHVPLVLDFKHERLAKRHAHFEIAKMREQGITAEAIIGYLAYAGGLSPTLQLCTPEHLIKAFDIAKLSRIPIVLPENIFEVLTQLSRTRSVSASR